MLDVTNDPGTDDGGLTYTPGPLTLLDPALTIPPFGDPGFEAFVNGELAGLGGSDAQLDAAHEGALAFAGADEVEGQAARLLDPAIDAHAEIRAALDNDDPSDVIAATNSHDSTIDAARGDYVETPPPDVAEPDPGTPPDDHGDPNDPHGPPI
jgi:hypothetical protein